MSLYVTFADPPPPPNVTNVTIFGPGISSISFRKFLKSSFINIIVKSFSALIRYFDPLLCLNFPAPHPADPSKYPQGEAISSDKKIKVPREQSDIKITLEERPIFFFRG